MRDLLFETVFPPPEKLVYDEKDNTYQYLEGTWIDEIDNLERREYVAKWNGWRMARRVQIGLDAELCESVARYFSMGMGCTGAIMSGERINEQLEAL